MKSALLSLVGLIQFRLWRNTCRSIVTIGLNWNVSLFSDVQINWSNFQWITFSCTEIVSKCLLVASIFQFLKRKKWGTAVNVQDEASNGQQHIHSSHSLSQLSTYISIVQSLSIRRVPSSGKQKQAFIQHRSTTTIILQSSEIENRQPPKTGWVKILKLQIEFNLCKTRAIDRMYANGYILSSLVYSKCYVNQNKLEHNGQ